MRSLWIQVDLFPIFYSAVCGKVVQQPGQGRGLEKLYHTEEI